MKKILLCLLLLLSLSACNKEKEVNGGTVVAPPKKNNGGDVVEPVKGYVDYQKIYEDTVLKDMYEFMVNDGHDEEFEPLRWFYENYFIQILVRNIIIQIFILSLMRLLI